MSVYMFAIVCWHVEFKYVQVVVMFAVIPNHSLDLYLSLSFFNSQDHKIYLFSQSKISCVDCDQRFEINVNRITTEATKSMALFNRWCFQSQKQNGSNSATIKACWRQNVTFNWWEQAVRQIKTDKYIRSMGIVAYKSRYFYMNDWAENRNIFHVERTIIFRLNFRMTFSVRN